MKYASTLVLFLLVSVPLLANNPANTFNEKVGIVQADTHTKENLYNNAKKWLNSKCLMDASINEFDETNNDSIVTTCSVSMSDHSFSHHGKFASTSEGLLKFNVNIDFKDGKYRYTINNMNYEFSLSGPPNVHGNHSFPLSDIDLIPERKVAKIEKEADEKVQDFITELNKNVLNETKLAW